MLNTRGTRKIIRYYIRSYLAFSLFQPVSVLWIQSPWILCTLYYTGLHRHRRNTVFVFVRLRHRNTWIRIFNTQGVCGWSNGAGAASGWSRECDILAQGARRWWHPPTERIRDWVWMGGSHGAMDCLAKLLTTRSSKLARSWRETIFSLLIINTAVYSRDKMELILRREWVVVERVWYRGREYSDLVCGWHMVKMELRRERGWSREAVIIPAGVHGEGDARQLRELVIECGWSKMEPNWENSWLGVDGREPWRHGLIVCLRGEYEYGYSWGRPKWINIISYNFRGYSMDIPFNTILYSILRLNNYRNIISYFFHRSTYSPRRIVWRSYWARAGLLANSGCLLFC